MQNIRLIFFLTFFLAVSVTENCRAQTAGTLTIKQLKDIYGQDNDTTYVVNFWATWCGPCVMEIPNLMQFYTAHQDSKIKLLLISLDQLKFEKRVKSFITKNNIPAPVYMLDAGNGFDWLPQIDERWEGSIPATMIINNSKNVKQFYEYPMENGQLDYILKKLGLD